MKVLLSIKPEFVKEIISGRKKYEYRKNIFKRADISTIVVYATKPIGKIVGEFDIQDILIKQPADLWAETKKESGITQAFFNEYFEGRDKGVAIHIKNYRSYPTPLDLKEFDSSIKSPPQSFCYTMET